MEDVKEKLSILQTWNGEPIADDEAVSVEFSVDDATFIVWVDAPFHNDPAPKTPKGSTDGLWEYEVVELFLLGESLRYLEIELGPHGHYFVLELRGQRRIERKHLPIDYRAEIVGARWHGKAQMPGSYLPLALRGVNAYAIHGQGANRRYLAAFSLKGTTPDFHQLDAFGDIEVF